MLVLILLVTALAVLYRYLTQTHDHWKKKGVPYFKPIPVFGNLWKLVSAKESPGEYLGALHNAPEARKERFMGMFLWNSEPALLIRDPELIKQIWVKDFAHFRNRNVWCDPEEDPIGHNNLFVLRDEKWKYLRTKLSPAFTSGKLKLMFKLITGVADELMKNIDERVEKSKGPVTIGTKELMARYTTDVISTTAFGIQSNSLNDEKAIFREFGRKIFHFTFRRSVEIRAFFFMHWLAKFLKAIFFNRESSQFFRDVFWDAMKVREEQNIVRNDFMDTLIDLKNETRKKLEADPDNKEVFEFEGDALVAQTVLFFTAGFETTSSSISNTLMELAYAPDVQKKLREEIVSTLAKNNGELTYEVLFEMKYLDMVVSEVLRKYPAMPIIDRVCTLDYKIPDSDLIIKKGTPVFVGMFDGLHYDPDHYPDPQKFDPDRFSEEGKASRHPFSYVPFGEGPHICIGMRFGLMNVKMALVRVLSKYKAEFPPGVTMPIPIDPATFLLTFKGNLDIVLSPV